MKELRNEMFGDHRRNRPEPSTEQRSDMGQQTSSWAANQRPTTKELPTVPTTQLLKTRMRIGLLMVPLPSFEPVQPCSDLHRVVGWHETSNQFCAANLCTAMRQSKRGFPPENESAPSAFGDASSERRPSALGPNSWRPRSTPTTISAEQMYPLDGGTDRRGGKRARGIRDDGAARPRYSKACGWYGAATSEAMAIGKARIFCNDAVSA